MQVCNRLSVKGESPAASGFTTLQLGETWLAVIKQHNQEEGGGGRGVLSVDWPPPPTYQVHWHAAKAAGTAWRQYEVAFDVPGGVPSNEQCSCATLIPVVSPKTNCHLPHGLLWHLNWLLHPVCRTGGCQGRGVVSRVSRADNDLEWKINICPVWGRCLNGPLVWLGVICCCEHGLRGVGDELWQAFRILL